MSITSWKTLRLIRQLHHAKNLDFRASVKSKCKVTYNHPRAQNQDFELPKYSRVLESSPDGFYLWNSLVLSIPRVSEPSDNFSSQKSGFWGKSWDQCTKYSKTTYNHLRSQNRDLELPRHFRVIGSPPYGVYLWNSRVQSILKFLEPSDNFWSQKSGFRGWWRNQTQK